MGESVSEGGWEKAEPPTRAGGLESHPLLQTGIEQVRDIFRLVERDEDLDLYDETDSS